MNYEELINTRNGIIRMIRRYKRRASEMHIMSLNLKLVDIENQILDMVPPDLLEELYV